MYINPFWCGFLATIGIEVVAIIVYAIKLEIDKKKNKYLED